MCLLGECFVRWGDRKKNLVRTQRYLAQRGLETKTRFPFFTSLPKFKGWLHEIFVYLHLLNFQHSLSSPKPEIRYYLKRRQTSLKKLSFFAERLLINFQIVTAWGWIFRNFGIFIFSWNIYCSYGDQKRIVIHILHFSCHSQIHTKRCLSRSHI